MKFTCFVPIFISFVPICEWFLSIFMGFNHGTLFSPFLELRYLFYSRSSHVSVVPILGSYFPIYEWFVPIFVIILMGDHLFLRYFFFTEVH